MIQESIERLADIDIPANPFPGLRPFEFHESYLFFGREGQSESLIDKLTRTRFLAVVGTSGSGKSSLVRAGLLPALIGGMMRQAGSAWRVALMRPGNDPIGNLATALNSRDAFGSEEEENRSLQIAITETTLRRGNLGLVETVRQANMSSSENLIVIADQFEELFRVGQDAKQEDAENDKAAFVKLLLEASRQREVSIYVVLTMRSDYLGDCAQFWDLPEAINEGQYLIPRLTYEQRRAAITGPAEMGGAEMTPRLVNRLMNDVGDNPDQLPILQHALMRTWDKWKEEDRPAEAVDLHHYEAIGGMSEALSRHADEAYNELPGELRTVAEKTFKALTEKGSDNREIRHQITLAEICAVVAAQEPDVIAVIDTFRRQGRSFLMPPAGTRLTADTLIDISHESLIRVWERLREWVSEEARSARQYQRLAETAMLRDKGEAGLWRDPDLQLALNWREQNRPNAAWARRYHPGLSSALAGLDAGQKQLELEKAFNQVSQFLDDSAKQRAAEIDKQAERQRLDEEHKERELIQAQALAEEQRRRAEGEARSARRLRGVVGALIVLILLAGAAAVIARIKTEEAEGARNDALYQKNIAEQKTIEAEEQKAAAEVAQGHAVEESIKAQVAERKASDEKTKADQARQKAEDLTKIAEQQKQAAEIAKDEAERQADEAKRQAKAVRQLLYASDMPLAQVAFDEKDRMRGYELLDNHLPASNTSKDLREDLRKFDWYYLWRANHNESATLKGLSSRATSVVFSPDGNVLANSDKNNIKLWDANNRRELRTLEGHTDVVLSVTFSPDGKLLASGGTDHTIRLWEVNTGQQLRLLKKGYVHSVAFSPDSRMLAAGSGDNTITVWEADTGKELTTLKGHSNAVLSVAFSPDGKTLASGSADQTVKLWEISTGQLLGDVGRHKGYIFSVAFSPDGKVLATGGWDEVIRLWEISTGKELTTLKGHSDFVHSVAFSPDGKLLASGSADNTVRLWKVGTGKELTTLEGHSNVVLSVAFSPSGKVLASSGADQTVKLWDLSKQHLLSEENPVTLEGDSDRIAAVALSPDGKLLASVGANKSITLWEVGTGKELTTLEGHLDLVGAVAFSPDGKLLASGGSLGTVKLWDVKTSKERITHTGHLSSVLSVAFSPDSRMLASGGADGLITLWEIGSDKEPTLLKGHSNNVNSVAFSSDSKLLASGSTDGFIKLWDVRAGKELPRFKGQSAIINSVAFSPDGKVLASGSWDKTITLWEVGTGKELNTLKGHLGRVSAVAFSPDGKVLVSGSDDKNIKLWDTNTGRLLITLKKHSGTVNSLTFSCDGKVLASGSSDGTIKLFFAATDQQVAAQRSN